MSKGATCVNDFNDIENIYLDQQMLDEVSEESYLAMCRAEKLEEFYLAPCSTSSSEHFGPSEELCSPSARNSEISDSDECGYESCDSDEECPSELEDIISEFEPILPKGDLCLSSGTLEANESSKFASIAAVRKSIRCHFLAVRARTVFQALHPRLGRDSPLRLLDEHTLSNIVELVEALDAPYLSQFLEFKEDFLKEQDDFFSNEVEKIANTQEHATVKNSNPKKYWTAGIQRYSIDRCALQIINHTITKVEKSLFRKDEISIALDTEVDTVAVLRPSSGFRLSSDAAEVLACASESFLEGLYMFATSVRTSVTPALPFA
jgi:hypothetical protein